MESCESCGDVHSECVVLHNLMKAFVQEVSLARDVIQTCSPGCSQSNGDIGVLGIVIDDQLCVIDVVPFSPASENDIVQLNDKLVEVDGTKLHSPLCTKEEVASLLAGPKGSTSILHIERVSGNVEDGTFRKQIFVFQLRRISRNLLLERIRTHNPSSATQSNSWLLGTSCCLSSMLLLHSIKTDLHSSIQEVKSLKRLIETNVTMKKEKVSTSL